MFEDVDIGESLKNSAVITGYFVLTIGILFGLVQKGYIETSIFDQLTVPVAVLGIAVVFNLVFAFTIVDQEY